MSYYIDLLFHRIPSVRPKLTELLNDLEKLSASEVRYLCTKLGVSKRIIDNIDADHRDSLTRVPNYFQAWLDADNNTTWDSIFEALRSETLNKGGLANNIQRKYCSTGKPLAKVPSSQSSNASSSRRTDKEHSCSKCNGSGDCPNLRRARDRKHMWECKNCQRAWFEVADSSLCYECKQCGTPVTV